jgi:hypothetical protein
MSQRRLSLALDGLLLLAVGTLHSWRLTGVPLHEWLGVALAGALVVHLLLHFSWIESRTRRLAEPGAWRNRANVALNGTLFAAMAGAVASGLFMAKSLFPGFQPVGEYLRWHGIHETCSNLALVLVGLHLGLNGDRVSAGLRRRAARGAVELRAGGSRAALAARRPFASTLRRAALVAGASAMVAVTAWALERSLPPTSSVMLVDRSGQVHVVPPPQEIASLRPDQLAPDPAAGAGRAALRLAIVGVTAFAGRRIFGLRLE